MALEISSAAVRAILWEADAAGAFEACGLLLGLDNRVTHVIPCRNVAEEPADTFEIDPVALFAAHRGARLGKPSIIGCYHSHPTGSLLPSLRDGAAASPAMPYWIILAGGSWGCWRLKEDGRFAGGFAPVNAHLIADGCTTVAPSPQGRNPYAS